MFKIESQAIRDWLAGLALEPGMRVLSIASGNRAMREKHQAFIHDNVFAPLAQRGLECIHHELHPADGVDITGDLHSQETQQKLAAVDAKVVLCCNLLEHVRERGRLAEALGRCLPPGSYLLLTVPRSFQYHADPIDTYYRPTPQEIQTLFPTLIVVRQDIVRVESMWSELRAEGGLGTLAFRLLRHLRRMITWLPQPRRWISHLHSTLWLVRERKVSMLLLRRG